MKNILFYTLLAIFLYIGGVYAQDTEKALARISKDAETTMQYHEYETAIELYQQLLKAKPDDLEYNYQIGVCYLNTSTRRTAYNHLKKVYDKNASYKPELEYYLGQAYQYKNEYSEAKTHFEKGKSNLEQLKSSINGNADLKGKEKEEKLAEVSKLLADCEKRIQECESGIQFESQPVNAHIENLGKTVNTEFPEYSPLIPQDSSFMVFTSRRDGTTGGKRDFGDDLYFEDIYVSFVGNDKKFSTPKQLPINHKFHDAAAAISPDGKTLYLYRDDAKTKGDLYEAKYDEATQTWAEPKKLNDNVNSKFNETSLCISKGGDTLYFASDRPEGKGGLDLYYSLKDASGEWGAATNLGDPINTQYDDDAPFLSFDEKTLYFSSRGHDTMGGYDVFKSQLGDDKKWKKPVNMGHPINGPDDDVHLVLTDDNRKGYYVSSDPSGEGDKDIYILTAPKPTLLKLDKSGIPLTTLANMNVGKVPNPDFQFSVRFGFDQSSLTPTSKESVDKLMTYLQTHQTVRIEVGGHTCNIGSVQYNQGLSERRAKAVANYLIERGVDANRIEVKGYSSSEPLEGNQNRTPQERAENRRADYKIIEK
jgi:outer membrane protein OmpA-like peptidoglycan-associated protein/tetratricopeptide (TPR) repeat protein